MSLQTYVFLLFGISIALFFAGYKPLMFSMLQCDTTQPTCNPDVNYGYNAINNLFNSLLNAPTLLGIIGVTAITGVLLGGSFGVVYTIPIIIVVVTLSNFILLPTDFLLDVSLPWEIKAIMIGFFNLLLLLALISFIRGGE
jgi:hypothetical protein